MINKFCCGLFLFVLTSTANALPISVSQQEAITSTGQLFNFVFNPMPTSDGTGGQFSVTLSGDYSPRTPPPLSEGATITLDVAGGSLELFNNSNSAAILSNTVAGLSLNNTSFSGSGNDVTLGYVFDMTSSLLNAVLADNSISVSVQNTGDVNVTGTNPFVRVGFDYESGTPVPTPEPTTAALLLFALAGLGFRRRT